MSEHLRRMWRTAASLDGLTFHTDFRKDWYGDRIEDGVGVAYALDNGTYAGSLFWNYLEEPPEVVSVEVPEEYRRRGIATRLWELAKSKESRLVHSISLTEDGRDWSRSLAKAAVGPSEQYLDQVTKMMANSPLNGRKYRSPMEAIRDRGKPWRNIAPSLPPHIKRGPMGNCFGNALNAVMADRNLIYVEGYAHSKFFPMAHAWVVDGNGTVYDPTWPEPAEDYFGIAFDTRWLLEYVSNSGYTSVFGTEFIHDGLIELLTKGIPDSAMNTTGGLR